MAPGSGEQKEAPARKREPKLLPSKQSRKIGQGDAKNRESYDFS